MSNFFCQSRQQLQITTSVNLKKSELPIGCLYSSGSDGCATYPHHRRSRHSIFKSYRIPQKNYESAFSQLVAMYWWYCLLAFRERDHPRLERSIVHID